MKDVHIITLGCEKNENDSENLKGLLQKKGYRVTTNIKNADAVVVHTCSFIEAAKKESLEAILTASQSKKKSSKLYVTGCLVQQHGKDLLADLPEADALLGTGQLEQIPELLETPKPRFLDRRDPGGLLDPDAKRALAPKSTTASLRLSEGCSHPCSFCVIPKLRGGLQSRPEAAILKEAQDLGERGVEEILIIGQDTGDWGRDLQGKPRLHDLLTKLEKIKTLRWIRLLYMHPHSLTDHAIDILAGNPEKFPYLDMPLQHIDSGILKRMNRYDDEKIIRGRIEKLKAKAPHLALRSTLIVGFPGETAGQFTRLNNFVREGYFDYLGAFAYSAEENTPAALMKYQVPERLRKERLNAVTEAQYDVSFQKANKRLGTTETILVERAEGDSVFGRTKMEAPEVDAVVRLPKKAVRRGKFVRAILKTYDAYEFTADPV